MEHLSWSQATEDITNIALVFLLCVPHVAASTPWHNNARTIGCSVSVVHQSSPATWRARQPVPAPAARRALTLAGESHALQFSTHRVCCRIIIHVKPWQLLVRPYHSIQVMKAELTQRRTVHQDYGQEAVRFWGLGPHMRPRVRHRQPLQPGTQCLEHGVHSPVQHSSAAHMAEAFSNKGLASAFASAEIISKNRQSLLSFAP